MRFHRIGELVRWAADYHAALADAYAAKALRADGERVRMALEHVAGRERALQGELERCLEDEGYRAVLDTWFDDPADILHAPVLGRPGEDVPCDSVSAVLGTALAAHRVLQDLYESRTERAVTTIEHDFFISLGVENETEVRRLARDMGRLEIY